MINGLRRLLGRVTAVGCFVAAVTVVATPSQAAVSHQIIEGSGSSWATNALNVWIANVTANGLKVVYTASGSATGRRDFGNQTTDFAVSDVGYQGVDPVTGAADTPCKLGQQDECRAYAYLPIVAGGLAFPYHLEINGQLVHDLRLSGLTLAKIFTGVITNWSDPEIRADNHGRRLPALPIIPVTHSEGSGASHQFTAYLDATYPAVYRAFTGTPGATLYFGPPPDGTSQPGSDGVINYVTSSSANGSIGYDEYSYALAKNYPVAQVENASRHYTLPNQFNVVAALRHAAIDDDPMSPDYGLAELAGVYSAPEPAAYPLSAYAYMIIPTGADDPRMNTAKRQTIADFITYSVCDGQGQVGPIGYSSLPLGLTTAAFSALQALKAADPGVDLTNRSVTSCNGNPTFAPGPPPFDTYSPPSPPLCDSEGWGPCDEGGATRITITRSATIAYGKAVTLSCTLRSGTGTVADRLQIQQARPGSADAWHTVTTKPTRSDGNGRLVVRPARSTAYRCFNPTSGVSSATTTLGVRKVVTARAHAARSRIRISGQVLPTVVGHRVQVQERVRGRWTTIGRATVGKHGYSYAFTTRRTGTVWLRATCAASPRMLAGTSPARYVTIPRRTRS